MLLMSCCGLGDRIKSTVLIGVATQNVGYAKSLLQGRLKYLSTAKVEFHCLMRPTESFQYPWAMTRGLQQGADSFKTHIDYSKDPRQSIISPSVFVTAFGFVGNTEKVSAGACVAPGHVICFAAHCIHCLQRDSGTKKCLKSSGHVFSFLLFPLSFPR